MAEPVYYLKETDILYRRADGDPQRLPDEVLWSSGWNPIIGGISISADAYPKPSRRGTISGGLDSAIGPMLTRITIEEARGIAMDRGLPTEGWEVTTPPPESA